MSSLLVPHPSGFLHTLHATLCFAAMRLCRAHSRSAFPGDHAAHPHAWARPAAGVAWAACAHGCGIRGGASGGRAFEWCPRCDREHRVLDVTWHSMPCGVESQEDVQTKGAQACHQRALKVCVALPSSVSECAWVWHGIWGGVSGGRAINKY
eukprot:scaffold130448_cov17-Tisochrysis_lutea.AAC.1